MQVFKFSLESVLQWRKIQAELEEHRLQTIFTELQKIAVDQQQAAEARAESHLRVKAHAFVSREDLVALDSFDQFSETQRLNFNRRRQDCGIRIAEQQKKVMETQRQFRLLEKLRDRKLVEWNKLFDAEQEALASEIYLAKLSRSQRGE
jgi:hypothetical protein